MNEDESSPNPSVNVEGDVNGNIIVGDGNVITTIRNYVFRDTRQLIVFVVIFLLVSSGIAVAFWYSKQPAKMTGDFNIAVAQFGEIKEDGSITPSMNAEKIRSILFDFLDSEYRASGPDLKVQIVSHNIPLIRESAQAEKLAKQINADIVIFGNISVQGDHAQLQPRFYVAERPEIYGVNQELTGTSELSLPITFTVSDLDSQNKATAELQRRTVVLFNFIKGWIYFSHDDSDSALSAVQAAITAVGNSDQKVAGEEVLYLLAAQVYTRKQDYKMAQQMLDQAFTLKPEDARVYLARGNVFYSQALDFGFDPELLEKAQSEYITAYQLPDEFEGAYISIKARIASGNILIIKAQQTNDPHLYDQAIENYTYVTKEYERTQNEFMRPYAAIAYSGLGAAYERQGKREQALDSYQRAYELIDDQVFKTRIEQQMKAVEGP